MNRLGPRVVFKRVQGLLSKSARLKGYLLIWTVGLRSGGSDLIGFSSNPVRPRPIVGLRYISCDGAAALARRRQIPRWGSPELAKLALQGLIRAGFSPWSTAMACVVHWRPWLGSWGSVVARAKAAAAMHGRASPACDARPPKGRYSLRNFAFVCMYVYVLDLFWRCDRE